MTSNMRLSGARVGRPQLCPLGLGPFLFADTRLLTAGPRAIAAALHSAGFTKTRIVLRQWNRLDEALAVARRHLAAADGR